MTNFFKNNKEILIVLVIACIVRFVNLDSLPALNADEAALGYNAYSLIQTGKDEHGNAWPMHFQSFNDYKPALYGYLIMPFIYFFGLNEMSVRFIGALFGVVNVYILYLLVKSLKLGDESSVLKIRMSPAVLSAFLLAISPWHIHFSRGGWEVNAATLFITLGLYFFERAIRKNSVNFVYSSIFFVLSLYTYHAARVLLPLLMLGMVFIYGKLLLGIKNKRVFFGSIIFAAILLAPLISGFFTPAVSARAGGVSIFADRGPIDRINEKRGQHGDLSSLVSLVFHNKVFEYTNEFAKNYFEHFWGEFLFLSGDDIQRNKVPEFGVLYLFQLPLLVFVFFKLCIAYKPQLNLFVWWLIVSPVPAALTFQSPHALRAQNMVIPITFFSGLGLYYLFDSLKSEGRLILKALSGAVLIIIFWSFARYLHQYNVHMAKTYPYSSQYGVKELMLFLSEREKDYKRIYVTDRYDQPYILYLFYTKHPPEKFQNNHVLTDRGKFGFSTVSEYGKYHFRSIKWQELRDERKILVAGTDAEISTEESNVIKTIYFPNGEIAFEVVEL